MSYNPYIQRILIEQIQEFETLDLQEFVTADYAGKLPTLVYDDATKKFTLIPFPDTFNGNITINKANLTRDHIASSASPMPTGFTFKLGWDLDQVVEAICNPPVPGTLALSAVPRLLEIKDPVVVTLSDNWASHKGTEGDKITSSIVYYRGQLNIGSSPLDSLTPSSIGIITYRIEFDTQTTATFPSSSKTATTTVKVVYPHFMGFDSNGIPPSTLVPNLNPNQPIVIKSPLEDIAATGRANLNFPSMVLPPNTGDPLPTEYYWFAVQKNFTPLSWVGLNPDGTEDPNNGGMIDATFNKLNDVDHNSEAYTIYMTKNYTYFATPIRIKF